MPLRCVVSESEDEEKRGLLLGERALEIRAYNSGAS